jgi:FAD-linked oxidoreductase
MGRSATWQNWARTASSTHVRVDRPRSIDELCAIVSEATGQGLRVKVPGSGHSFTPIAVTDGVLIAPQRLDDVCSIDESTGLVTVESGIPLYRLNRILDEHGLALPSLGDIDWQTIAGAISTGTHGTGIRRQGIAAAVEGLDLVRPTGSLVSCSANESPELFGAARVGLGAIGIIARVTLRCVPAFLLHAMEGPMPLDIVLGNIDDLVEYNDHFEFSWFPHTSTTSVKRNNRVPAGTSRDPLPKARAWIDDELLSNKALGALNKVVSHHRSWIPRLNQVSSRALTAREYIDDSYRVFVSPRRVRLRETEWAVPRDRLVNVLLDIKSWIDAGNDTISFPVEIRFAAGDDIWLSTGYHRDNAYIAVHHYEAIDYQPYFRAVQDIAAAAGGRPHWGKLHFLDVEALRPRYPRFDDFLAIRRQVDPCGSFTNDYLDRVLGPIV